MKNYSEDPSRQYHIQVAKGEVGLTDCSCYPVCISLIQYSAILFYGDCNNRILQIKDSLLVKSENDFFILICARYC